ncbi:hypothetical protein JW935_00630 [candidate division KSB1 bacterium]|nr:hypothetical protein [candidate division KSB1 bacterium]
MKRISLYFLVFWLTGRLFAQTVFVPVQHRVYEFLDRMETGGVLPVVLSGTRPLTRLQIAGYLQELEPKVSLLTGTDRQMLDYLRNEFYTELDLQPAKNTRISRLVSGILDPALPDFFYANGRNMLLLNSDPLNLFWDPVVFWGNKWISSDTLASGVTERQSTFGFVMWGTVGESIGFISDVRDTKESGSFSYPPRKNMTLECLGFVQANGDHIYHDETTASVVLNRRFWTVQFGKDFNRWGPGIRGQLALSDYATSYDQFKFQARGKRWTFTSLVAFLKHYSDDYFEGGHAEKTLAGHRLEFSPFRFIDIGLHETVVYTGRKFEPGYLNPVMFFRSAEHYLGDRDNAAMGLDVEIKVVRGTKLYGELFVDDVTTTKLGTGFYGNKYAYTGGLFCTNVLGADNLDLRIEYTRIRPYVYSHKFEKTGYWHFSTTLGHWIGPNADNLYFGLTYQPTHRWRFYCSTDFMRHGRNFTDSNVGGNMYVPRDATKDAEYVDFLAGDRENFATGSSGVRYEFLRDGFISLDYTRIISKYPGRPAAGGYDRFDAWNVFLRMSVNY